MLVSWSSNHQTSLNIPWKSTDQQDVHFHFYQIFPLVLYYTHTFSSPFHICLPRNSQRVRWAEGLLKTFLQKNPTSAPVYLWWGKVFSKHRLFQWFFNLPRNRSPARFLELALLCVLWIDTIFHTPPGVHRPKGKKSLPFTQPHWRCASARGAWGVSDPGRHPIHCAHKLPGASEQVTDNSSTAQAPAAHPTLHTPQWYHTSLHHNSDNVCKAMQGSWDESLLRLKLFTLREWDDVGACHTQNLRDLFPPQASWIRGTWEESWSKNNQAKSNYGKIIISGQFFPDRNADLNINLISFS